MIYDMTATALPSASEHSKYRRVQDVLEEEPVWGQAEPNRKGPIPVIGEREQQVRGDLWENAVSGLLWEVCDLRGTDHGKECDGADGDVAPGGVACGGERGHERVLIWRAASEAGCVRAE